MLAKTVKGASTIWAGTECLARSSVVSSMPAAAACPSTTAEAVNTPQKSNRRARLKACSLTVWPTSCAQSVRLLIASEARKNPAAAAGQE